MIKEFILTDQAVAGKSTRRSIVATLRSSSWREYSIPSELESHQSNDQRINVMDLETAFTRLVASGRSKFKFVDYKIRITF
jgi:hypothetical protein